MMKLNKLKTEFVYHKSLIAGKTKHKHANKLNAKFDSNWEVVSNWNVHIDKCHKWYFKCRKSIDKSI